MTTAVEHEDDATRLAGVLLDARLAACVQVLGPVTSRYWWQGTRATATEYLVVAKTAADRAEQAVATLVAAHTYDVPEVVVVPIVAGNPAYLDWIIAETRPAPPTS